MKRILTIFVIIALVLTCVTIPVSAETISAYEFVSVKKINKDLSTLTSAFHYTGDLAGGLNPGTILVFTVDFGSESPIGLISNAAWPEDRTTYFHLDAADGPLIAEVPVVPIDYTTSQPTTVKINTKVTGVHNVYVSWNKQHCNYYGFQFIAPTKKAFEYSSYDGKNIYTDIEDTAIKTKAELLWGLGILRNDKGTEFKGNLPVSRGEFADAVYGILEERMTAEEEKNKETIGDVAPIETGYSDVAGDSKFAEAVAYLTQNGVMNGTSETSFSPHTFITNLEAVTVLLRIMGYSQLANEYGGYPAGYSTLASKTKLIGKANLNNVMTRTDLVSVLYNVLTTDSLSLFGVLHPNYGLYEKAGGILETTQNVYHGLGKVTATPISGLGMANARSKADTVAIDGVVYNIGSTNAASMLGYECEFFYEEVDGKKTLRALTAEQGVEFSEIYSEREEIIELSNDKIVYTKEDSDKNITVTLTGETNVIYNGVAAHMHLSDMLTNASDFNGYIRVAENPDGTKVISIDEHVDYIIESVDVHNGVIVGKGAHRENIKITNNDYSVIKDEANNDIMLNELLVGDVITTYTSKNDEIKLIRIYKSVDSVTGVVSAQDADGSYYIDGTKRVASNNIMQNINVGQKAQILFNIYGDIVALQPLDPDVWSVGVVIGKNIIDTGFGKEAEIKVFTKDGKSEVYCIDDRITADGVLLSDIDKILNGSDEWCGVNGLVKYLPIRYKLNSDGRLKVIDTPKDAALISDNEKMDDNNMLVKLYSSVEETTSAYYYKDGEAVFDNSDKKTKAYLSPDAMVFAFYGDDVENSNYYVGKPSARIFPANYVKVWGGFYSTIGDRYKSDLFVWDNMQTILSNANNYTYSDIVFKSYAEAVALDGDIYLTLYCGNGSDTLEYYLDESAVRSADDIVRAKNCKPGDIIRINAYPDNRIYDITYSALANGMDKRLDDAGATITAVAEKVSNLSGLSGTSIGDRYIYGTIKYKGDGYVIIDYDSTENEKLEIVPVGKAKLCRIQEIQGGSGVNVHSIDSANICVGDHMFVYLRSGKAITIIVYEDEE